MRYVPAEQLKAGMTLGQELHDASGTMLLNRNTKLTQENITYLRYIGLAGVYIDDEISRNIEITPVIQKEVHQEALQMIRNVFSKAAEEENLGPEESLVRLMAETVVNDVMLEDDVVYNMVDLKTYNGYTYFHAMNVGVICAVIGANLDLDEEEMQDLVMAAFLHDIGKVFIRPELLDAPRPLTEEEIKEMREHPRKGYEYLKQEFHFPQRVIEAVYEHHEWYNGMGYPRGLHDGETLRIAQILRVADVYDAMVSKRPYHEAYLPADVMEYIMARSGMEFSPEIVKVMTARMALYPLGSEVVLSDGRHAIVVENHAGFMGRPTVRPVDGSGEIDLLADRSAYNITIVKLLM